MRLLCVIGLSATLAAVGCASPASPASLTMPTMTGSGTTTALTGTWVGSTSDSTNSMMGAGWSAYARGNVTWNLTQEGNTFSGTMHYPGHHGGSMAVSGTVDGHVGTFTMTIPAGSMMSMMMTACSSTATGTFNLDDHMVEMHGTFAGMNTCSGPFNRGQMSLNRR